MRCSWLIVLGSLGVVGCTVDVSTLKAHLREGDGSVVDVAQEDVAGDAGADVSDTPIPGNTSDAAGDAPQSDVLADMIVADVDASTVLPDASGNIVDIGGVGRDAGNDAQPDASMDTGNTTDSLTPDAGDAGSTDAYDAPSEVAPDTTPAEDGLPDVPGPEADANAAPFCDRSDPTLAACFRFEGNTLDESSYANATSSTGASYQQGVAGQSLRTGIGSNITVAESRTLDFTTAMTLELWARPVSLPTGTGRAALIDNDAQYGLFIYAGGDVTCSTSGSTVTASQGIAVNRWTHLACVFDGGARTLKVYVDGVLRATQNVSISSLSTTNRDGTAIGRNSPSGDSFNGEIDGLRLWSVVRPANSLCTTQATCG